MDQVLSCSLCKQRFVDDVVKLIAECGKNVCERCYESFRDDVDKESGRFKCPVCQNEHKMPPGGLSDNELLLTIIRNLPKKPMPESARELEKQVRQLKDQFEKLQAFDGAELVELRCQQVEQEVQDAITSAVDHLKKIEAKMLNKISEYKSECLAARSTKAGKRDEKLARLQSEIGSFSARWNEYFQDYESYESESDIEAARLQAAEFSSAIESTEKSLIEDAYGRKKAVFKPNTEFCQNWDYIGAVEFSDDLSDTSAAEKSQHSLNLVLLGESGVGKSSLVNLFANLLAYDTFETVQRGELKCPVPMSFNLVDENYESVDIRIGEFPGDNHGNEPNTYCFEAKIVNGESHRLNIIDTPGFGNSRGIEHERKNLDQVIEYLNQFEGLNAICLVLRPNDSRLTRQFHYCLKELLVRLDRASAPNICFCYTHARGTSFRPGNGYELIKSEMADIFEQSGTLIPVEQSNTFCFDSEAVFYLAARSKGIQFENSSLENFRNSWEHSADALNKMIIHATNVRPISVKSIFMLNQARKTLIGLGRPVAKLSRLIQTNLKLAQERPSEIQGVDDLKARQKWLITSIAKIAKYIKHKSILAYISDFVENLDLIIREEKQKMMESGNKTILKGLRKVKRDYIAEVEIVTDSVNANGNSEMASDAEIEQLFRELKEIKIDDIDLSQYVS